MGKGDIRTRRGKIWRGTYGVTRPRRYKTVIKPRATTRKAKSLKDLPKVSAEAVVKKPVAEVQNEAATEAVAEVSVNATAGAEATSAEVEAGTAAKKPRKAPAKKPAAKKAPKKSEE